MSYLKGLLMPKIIQLEDIKNTLTASGSHWQLEDGKNPERKYAEAGHLLLKLKCGLCSNKVWVTYSHIKSRKSKCCKKCSRIPSLDKMRALIQKYDQLWIPSQVHKSVKNRRFFWMKCSGCSKHFWIAWSKFSQGLSTGCRSCTKRKIHASLKDPTRYYKHPLMATWRRMGAHTIKDKSARKWESFQAFKEWTLAQGVVFTSEPVLKKKDKTKPFSPENCYWVNTKETGRNTIRIGGYT